MASPFHRWLPSAPAISSGVDGSWGVHDQRRPAFVVASRWSPVCRKRCFGVWSVKRMSNRHALAYAWKRSRRFIEMQAVQQGLDRATPLAGI
jgi:hypothetical protein